MRKAAFACCSTAATLVALSILAAPAAAAPTVVAGGMSDPRGISAGPGERLLVAQSGSESGEITQIRDADDDEPVISAFASVPVDPMLGGPVDVAASSFRKAYVLSGGKLFRVRRGGEASLVADIAAYQLGDRDPDDQEGSPTDSNPNGLALLKGGRILVADAAGNDLLLVDDDGEITTVARFRPEVVEWPDVLGPAPLDPVLAEAVPTAVAVGPDGAWYVTELKGFPFVNGSSRIWRIEPGATGAICDPTHPDSGPCRTVETGFTSVIDLAFGDDGELYVLEIMKEGLLGVEQFGAEPIGALWLVEDGSKTEIEPGSLIAPGGVAVGEDEELYVTTATFLGHGAGEVVRIDAPEEDD